MIPPPWMFSACFPGLGNDGCLGVGGLVEECSVCWCVVLLWRFFFIFFVSVSLFVIVLLCCVLVVFGYSCFVSWVFLVDAMLECFLLFGL